MRIKEKLAEPDEVQPVEIVDVEQPTDAPAPKKRGRKPGSTNAKKPRGMQPESLSRTIMLAHNVPARLLHQPIWELDKSESDLLASAILDVLNAFDLPVDPKAEAIIGLIGAAAAVYAPRVMSMAKQRRQIAQQLTDDAATAH